jgi:crotonobetainyl-CoA:carnitine CoA-transferase CaiB-like acyl-CoA transferase
MAGALDGINVLDFTMWYAGPFCTLLLRDLGAEIIKVERTVNDGGEAPRKNKPHTAAEESGAFIQLNRGKKSITLNTTTQKGKDIVKALAQKVDVLIENFTPGVMERFGLGSKELCKLNPRLVYASISGFGHSGPRQFDVVFDPVAQAMGGMMSVTGYPDGTPTKVGVPMGDLVTGIFTAVAILAALRHRDKTGQGQAIDMSLQDCVFLPTAMWCGPTYFIDGKVPQRYGNGDEWLTPANLYTAKDGYVYIASPLLGQTQNLFKTMGRADLLDSPLCAEGNIRIKYKKEIDDLIGQWTKTKMVAEILDALKKADVPCSAVPDFAQVCSDPQIKQREMVIDVEQTLSGRVKAAGSIFKLSKTPGNIKFPAPFLGEHNLEIYHEVLGFAENEIARMADENVI